MWALLLGLTGCTGAATPTVETPSDDATQPTAPASADPTAPPTEQDWAMDWTQSFTMQLPNGWVVRDCEGDRTHVCVHAARAAATSRSKLTRRPTP